MIHLPHEPRKILIVKPSALGDVVHTLPILRLLRRRFPAAHIAWLINPPFAGLIENHPDLNEVIRFERRRFANSWRDPSAAAGLWNFKKELSSAKFDLAIDLQGLLRSAWLTWYTGAPIRVGFANAREMAPFFYTHRVRVKDVEVHAIERYLTLAEELGCARGPVEFDFAVNDEDRVAVDGKLRELFKVETSNVEGEAPAEPSSQVASTNERLGRSLALHLAVPRFAVLFPGTNWPTKRWPAEKFSRLTAMLREQFGLESIVAGAADTPAVDGAHSLVGKTSLKQLVALMERAAVVIANDTGPMHIASALNRPLVSLFGPTNPVRTGPYKRMDTVLRVNIACSPCYSRKCSHQSCMQWLKEDAVAAAVNAAIA